MAEAGRCGNRAGSKPDGRRVNRRGNQRVVVALEMQQVAPGLRPNHMLGDADALAVDLGLFQHPFRLGIAPGDRFEEFRGGGERGQNRSG